MYDSVRYSSLNGSRRPSRWHNPKVLMTGLGLGVFIIVLVITFSDSMSNPFYAFFRLFTSHESQKSVHGGSVEHEHAKPNTNGGQSPRVKVRNGTIVGIHNADLDEDLFLGVPYAQPPVDDLRFRVPQSLNTSWTTPKPAVKKAKSCWISPVKDPKGQESQFWAEDCLYLNIVRPAKSTGEKLPVTVFIHGGNYRRGTTSDWHFNLMPTVANSVKLGKPIIALSINYRIGGWGMLASDALIQTGNTNLALRDQRLALHWIQENIAAFGGDPSKVTVWGNSAGSSSVGFHLLAYGGRDDSLFRAAIMHSGSPIPYQAMKETHYHQSLYDRVANQVGCSKLTDGIPCMRRVSHQDLNAAFNALQLIDWFPIQDGDLVKDFPTAQLERGDFVRVPILIGTNTDEGVSFAPLGIKDIRDFMNCIQVPTKQPPEARISAALAQKLAQAYPDDPCKGSPACLGCKRLPMPYGAQYRRCALYIGDATFIASRRRTCMIWASNSLPAYSYRFNVLPGNGSSTFRGVRHWEEVSFAFDVEGGVMGYLHDPPGQTALQKSQAKRHEKHYLELARLMNRSWISFIHDLDPNSFRYGGSSLPIWPVYKSNDPQNFVFEGEAPSHAEMDTFRAKGIKLINDAHKEYQR